jgi:hypothetical protein
MQPPGSCIRCFPYLSARVNNPPNLNPHSCQKQQASQDEGKEDGRLTAFTLHGRHPSWRNVDSADTVVSGPRPKPLPPGTIMGMRAVTRVRTVVPTTPPGTRTNTAASRMMGWPAKDE